MHALEALSTIKLGRAALIALILADTLGCGLLALFVCWPSFYVDTDSVKLAMTAVALTLPFVTAGTFVYHICAIDRDYDGISSGLQQSVIFALSIHVTWVLGALAAGATAPYGPNPVWLPPPDPRTVFWISSGFYIVTMLFMGKSIEHDRRWLRLAPMGVVALVGGVWTLWKYGQWVSWW